ncbi:phage tail fiber protein [Litchfieldia alkalitelluris]|uniref:phage tail fiber protein n=1 Tax=Litchfieldia alkalitelluris TaxID=304268 RepID=UPI0009972B15|nr:hypothetical protein [Litchfieldia alkalitelluris]
MSKLSNYLESALLNHVLRGTAMTAPAGVYVSLHTADPTDAGGSEVTTTAYPAYTRKQATFNAPVSGANSTTVTNSAELSWTYDGASSLTISHVSIYDASTAGNLLWHGALSASKTVANGDIFKIGAGNLTVGLD